MRRNGVTTILDPEGLFLKKWTKLVVICCVAAQCVDPLLFYIPLVDTEKFCFSIDNELAIAVCLLRSLTDAFYVVNIFLRFRTGFVDPSSRLLVTNSKAIAKRYLLSYFFIDIVSVFPLPQVVAAMAISTAGTPIKIRTLMFLIIAQNFASLMRLVPLVKVLTRSSGSIPAWAGAAWNFCFYMLASHIVGAFWYIASVERAEICWRLACLDNGNCRFDDLYCGGDHQGMNLFVNSFCSPLDPSETDFVYSIYLNAIKLQHRKEFFSRFFYCFVWGLRNLSSLGQNLETSNYGIGENCFVVVISFTGLILFSILAGNIQRYVQCLTVRADEMTVKRQDLEQWMSRNALPRDLRSRVRWHAEYQWMKTRGVDEESLIRDLPKDLRRDIMRHQCLSLLYRVPMFNKMDGRVKDALSCCLKRVFFTRNSYIAREGDRADEMLFIVTGSILSTSIRIGGRKILKAGDFCGEELLTWAMDPNSSSSLLISATTLRALSNVEAFSLARYDLRSVVSQFRDLDGEHFEHIFRFNSQQWRSQAAFIIQSAWRQYHQRKMAEDRVGNSSSFGATIYASRFATRIRRRLLQIRTHLPSIASHTQSQCRDSS